MATQTELSDEEENEEKVLETEISALRSAKKELFEKARPINEELERIAQRERECVDRLHRLATKRHDRRKYQQTVQRLVELESQAKHLKCENAKLSDTNSKLKQTLDEATKYSKLQKQNITELECRVTVAERELDWARAAAQQPRDSTDNGTVIKLQKQVSEIHKLLNKTKDELNETRQRLCEVQERLTVAEQVTAATQQRAVLESDNSQELLLELSSQHRTTTHAG